MDRNDSSAAISTLASQYGDSGSEEEGEINNISESDDESHLSAASLKRPPTPLQPPTDEDSLSKAPKLESKGLLIYVFISILSMPL